MGHLQSSDAHASHFLHNHQLDVIQHNITSKQLSITAYQSRTLYLHIDSTLSKQLQQYDTHVYKSHIHELNNYSQLYITINIVSGAIHTLQWDTNSSFIHVDRNNSTSVLHTMNHNNTIRLQFNKSHTHHWKPGIYKLTLVNNDINDTIFNIRVHSTISPVDTSVLHEQHSYDQQRIDELQHELSDAQNRIHQLNIQLNELTHSSNAVSDTVQQLTVRHKQQIDELHSHYNNQLIELTDQHTTHTQQLNIHITNKTSELLSGMNQHKRARAELLITKLRSDCMRPVYRAWKQYAMKQKKYKLMVLHKYTHRMLHSQLYNVLRTWHGYSQWITATNKQTQLQSKYRQLRTTVKDRVSDLVGQKQLLHTQLIELRDRHTTHVVSAQSLRMQTTLFLKWKHYSNSQKTIKHNILIRTIRHMEQLPKYNVWRQWRLYAHNQQVIPPPIQRTHESELSELRVQLQSQAQLLHDSQHSAYEHQLKYTTLYKQFMINNELLNVLLPVFNTFQCRINPMITDRLHSFCDNNCNCNQCIIQAKTTFMLVKKLMNTMNTNQNLRAALDQHIQSNTNNKQLLSQPHNTSNKIKRITNKPTKTLKNNYVEL